MNRVSLLAAAIAVAASIGCGPQPPSLGSSSQAATAGPDQREGQSLNGTTVEAYAPILQGCDLTASLRGTALPFGCSNNGPLRSSPLAWVRLDGVTLEDGSPVGSVALAGTRFSGLVNGAAIGGEDFEKARFTGVATSGAAVTLRAEHVERPSDHQPDVFRYEFRYLDAKGDWKNLCEGGKAVVVSGRWDSHEGVHGDGAKIADPTVFTIGCRRSAIEKCINGGYRPWASKDGVSLDPYHQACVRMLRADYCGDAVSHTVTGRKIGLFDPLGIQRNDERWVSEAQWNPSGAICLNKLNLTAEDAPCLASLGTDTCGDASSITSDTLLISETPHIGGRDGRL